MTNVSLDQALANLRKAMGDTYYPNGKPEPCHWCHKDCGGTCLGLTGSMQMKSSDPAYWMLKGLGTPKPIHRAGCYICEDPEFAQMGLPLCKPCPQCSHDEIHGGAAPTQGHIPADDEECDDCDYNARTAWEEEQEKKASGE